MEPVRIRRRADPHRPGIAPALGLRAVIDDFSSYRRPSSPKGDAHHVDFPEQSRTPAPPPERHPFPGAPAAPVPTEARRARGTYRPEYPDRPEHARQGGGLAPRYHHQIEERRHDRLRPQP